MSDISWGMGEKADSMLSWGFVKGIFKKVAELIRRGFRHIYHPEKFVFTIPIIGSVVRPFRKTYEIRGKRIIKHIIDFLLEDEDEDDI